MATAGKDKAETSGSGGKTDTTKPYEYDVSEGSSVILDARDFLPPDEINSGSSYSWTPIEGTTLSTDARTKVFILSTLPHPLKEFMLDQVSLLASITLFAVRDSKNI